MFRKSPDASTREQPLAKIFQRMPGMTGQGFRFGQSQERQQRMFANYSGWSLKPQFREDLGDRAEFMERMLRMMGPSMLGGQGKMFYQFMSPPEEPAPPQENSFADMLSGVFSRGDANRRNAMASTLGNLMMSRKR
jgi:hypothetical protein